MANKKPRIYIKPSNRGKFNATKKRTGKSTEELTHSPNPLTRKRAIFAQNAAKWKHAYGGQIPQYALGGDIYTDTSSTQAGIQAVGKINPVIGGIAAVSESIVGPIEQQAKRVNQRTGEYENFGAAQRADIARSSFDPFTAGTRSLQDPDASFGEKALSFTGLGGLMSKKKLKRQEAKRKEAIQEQQLQQYGQQRLANLQPQQQYSFANGGVVGRGTGVGASDWDMGKLIQDPIENAKSFRTVATKFKDSYDIGKILPLEKDKKASAYIKEKYKHPYTRFATITNRETGESSYQPVLSSKELEKIAKTRGREVYANGGMIDGGPVKDGVSDEYWNVSGEFLGNANKLSNRLSKEIIRNEDIPMDVRREALYANTQLEKELPLTMSALDDESNMNEMKYFNSLLGRVEGFLTPENIKTATAPNTLGNIYKKGKLLRQSPIRANDLDSLKKYAPEFYEEFNMGLARPLLKSGEYANGGQIPQEMLQQGAANAEVEGGESAVLPNGDNVEFEGPGHAAGGIDINAPGGTQIFSDRLKVPGTNKTFSDVNKKLSKNIEKYEKVTEDPYSTSLARRTAEMNLDNSKGEQHMLFVDQQRLNQQRGGFKDKGKFQDGGLTEPEMEIEPWMTDQYAGWAGMSNNVTVDQGDYDKALGNIQSGNLMSTGQRAGNLLSGDSKLGQGLAGLANAGPALYNIGRGLFGKADTQKPEYNLAGASAVAALQNRRYNIDPILAANRRAERYGKANIKSASRSRGELLGGYAGLSASRAAADAGAYAQASNIQGQYQGEAAQLAAGVGAQDVQARRAAAQYNAQAQAAQSNILGTGLSQLSAATQQGIRNRRLAAADKMRIGTLQTMYPNLKYNPRTGGYETV